MLRKSETKVTVHCERKSAPKRHQVRAVSPSDMTADSGTRFTRNPVRPCSEPMSTRPPPRRRRTAATTAGSTAFTSAEIAAASTAIPACTPAARDAANAMPANGTHRERDATSSAPRARPSAGQTKSGKRAWTGSAAANIASA